MGEADLDEARSTLGVLWVQSVVVMGGSNMCDVRPCA